MNRATLILTLWLTSMLLSCGKHGHNHHPVKRGFYIWQTTYSSANKNDSVFQTLNISTLYTKLFEVDWDEATQDAVPVGNFNYSQSDDLYYHDSLDYIPVIFITNETFIHLNDSQVTQLAYRVAKKIHASINQASLNHLYNFRYGNRYEGNEFSYSDDDPYRQQSFDFMEMSRLDSIRNAIGKNIKEYQFDCDWTETTRDKYFRFLNQMKTLLPNKTISCTIRLYPFKYPEKAGVPPVDKGMLMCYNTGDIRKMDSPNSIFSKKEIKKYLNNKQPYPLMLDYALPIFTWAAVYRNNKIIHLLQPDGLNLEYYQEYYKKEKVAKQDVEKYTVLKENTIGYGSDQIILKPGDVIKIETPNLNDVASIAARLGSLNTNPDPIMSLFYFDRKTIKANEHAIQKIYRSF